MIVLRRFLADRRRSLSWWALGVGLYILSNQSFYPSVKKVKGFEDIFKNMPRGLKNLVGSSDLIPITSPAGYQQARLFGLVLPLLLVIFAIGVGAYAIGGSEEDGTLEFLLANPVSRARLLLERYGAFAGLVLALGVFSAAAIFALSPPFGLLDGVSVAGLLATCGAATLMALLFGSIAFTAGAFTGKRSVAIAAATVVAVAGNLLNVLAESTDALHPFRFVTPWHWYAGRNMLAQGIALDALLLPLGVSIAFVAVAYWVFQRRDLR